MIVNFNVAQMKGAVFDEKSQVSYILKSLSKSFLQFCSNVEMNKIEYNMTTLLKELQIFQSLKGQKEGEANVAHSKRFSHSSSRSKKIQKRKERKGKGLTVAVEGKGKAKVAIKGKCFQCDVDGQWKRNCPKYLAKKKEKEGATNHVCSSLQENSSFKQLEESEMTLKVGTGDVISARAVGDAKVKEPLELIHSDLCSPMNVKARWGFEYFISFIDDYSRYGYLYLMEHKSEVLEKFKEYNAEVDNLLTLGTPQQNGVLERRNRTLLDMVRSMMSYAQLPSSFWGYAVETAVHILNNVSSKSVSKTPFELWRGQTRGGIFFDPQENRVFVSTNATFLEEDRMRDHKPRSKLVLNEATDETTRVVDEVGPSSRVDEITTLYQSHPSQSLRISRRSRRIVSQPNRYLGLTKTQVVIPDDGVEDPLSYKQAMNDVDKDQWVKAMDLEMESMILLSIATFYDYEIWQMDVKTPFLNGNLEESIFMSQPEGFITQGQEQKVCKLNRSIYGLKQASRSWNIRFDTTIKSYDFDQNVNEPCVYKKINKGKVAFLVLYVDDFLFIGNDVGYLTDIKNWLAVQFQMKDLGEAQYVLGIQIIRDRKNKMLVLSQATYIDKMLVRYLMQNSKKGLFPFRHGVHLSKEQCPETPQEVEDMRRIPYASTVDSLMYAMLCTRPDICYAVGIVSRYQSNPGLDHWTTVKIILKYLRRTRYYMLVYGAKDLILTEYTDSDFQTDKDSRKSTSRSVFTLNEGAVVWCSIKQGCIADSTMEAEYVAAREAVKEAVWLRKLFQT
ncbi:gag/pol protein [Cucumis melo var. makuwa]|uniref:Gag/pol protein n=1 Tax=Cucumis melo var. makuwa TaxID=1194695 RepID=A0A5D3BNP0_CUCMM|nr:gag/pol protein [Cucumis melo var. makuwa]